MKRLFKGIVFVLFLILGTFFILNPVTTAQAKTLKIGALFTLTGPASGPMKIYVEGVLAAAERINEKGGIKIDGNKYLIEVVLGDTMMSPDAAVSAANKLVYNQKVKFMLGPVIPFLSMAVGRITEEAKVLRIKALSPGSPKEIGPYTFLQKATMSAIPPLIDYLLEAYPGTKKMALICPAEPGAIVSRDKFKQVAEKQGISIVLEEGYPIGTMDFYPLWSKILKAKPDALNTGPGLYAWSGAILKQGRELGFRGPVFGLGNGDPADVKKVAGKEWATDYFGADITMKSPEVIKLIGEIKSKVLEKYGTEVTTDHVYGWELMSIMAQAIEKAQSLDTTVVAQTLEAMRDFKSPFGKYFIGGAKSFGHNRVILRREAISGINKAGEVSHIKWFTPSLP